MEKLKTKDKFNDLLQSEKNLMEENLNSKICEIKTPRPKEKNKPLVVPNIKPNIPAKL